MIKTISRTNDTILVVDDNGVKTARADHPKWTEICALFNQISYVPDILGGGGAFVGPTTELLDTMDLKTAIETYTVGLLSVTALGVTYAGRPIHTIDADRVMSFMREKLSYKPIANYIARKMKNPSARAIKEMYNFLENMGMPLTLRGTFIAYKGVATDFWSIRGNKDTVVLQGEVNSEGKILNTIGATIEVERSSVDDDFRNGCGAGLHAGSLSYAKGWGKRVVLVEIDPADVVSVPEDCSCQKLRCCKYTVVGEYSGPMPNTLTTEFDSDDDGENDICHGCGNILEDCSCDDEDNDAERNAECDGNCGDLDCPAKQRLNEAWLYEQSKKENAQREQDGMLPVPMPEEPTDSIPPVEMPDACGCGHCQHATINIPPPLPVKLDAPINNDVYTRVVNILVEQLGLNAHEYNRLDSNTKVSYDSLGMDSLDSVEVCMALEEEFGIEIPDELAEKHENCTVGDIVRAIEAYDQGRTNGGIDSTHQVRAAWNYGDWNGADSNVHMAYIYGYVAGYSAH